MEVAEYRPPQLALEPIFSSEKVFSLNNKGITELTENDINGHQSEKVLDLSDNQIRYLPEFLKDYSFEQIIVSRNHDVLTQHLTDKFPQWIIDKNIVIIAHGMGIDTLPKGVPADLLKCEVEFTSQKYDRGLEVQ